MTKYNPTMIIGSQQLPRRRSPETHRTELRNHRVNSATTTHLLQSPHSLSSFSLYTSPPPPCLRSRLLSPSPGPSSSPASSQSERTREVAGFVVMAIHLAANLRYGAMLLAFFFTSSALTKRGAERKREVDAEYKEGGQRNWLIQVGNDLFRIVLCPTSHRIVKKDTNGAVTKTGLIAAANAVAVIGLLYYLSGLLVCLFGEAALKQLLIIPLSALMGLCGSLIDSLLGATVRYSGYCQLRKKIVGKPAPTAKKISGLDILDNNNINLAPILLTSLLTSHFPCPF
ncbi:PGR-like protein [Drosera capensis]